MVRVRSSANEKWSFEIATMWGPPSDVSWFRFAPVTIVISTINHGYWSYKPTYLSWGPHIVCQIARGDMGWPWLASLFWCSMRGLNGSVLDPCDVELVPLFGMINLPTDASSFCQARKYIIVTIIIIIIIIIILISLPLIFITSPEENVVEVGIYTYFCQFDLRTDPRPMSPGRRLVQYQGCPAARSHHDTTEMVTWSGLRDEFRHGDHVKPGCNICFPYNEHQWLVGGLKHGFYFP